jgi:addiction module HigA family antidote
MSSQSLRDPARRPTHPGALLRQDILPSLKMTQKEFADWIGVSRLTISELVNEKRSVTPDMAMRLGKALGSGPQIWLRMQQTLDLWELSQRDTYRDIKTLERSH